MMGPDDDPPTKGDPAPRRDARPPDRERLFVGPQANPDEYELVDEGRRGGEGSVFRARYRGTLPHPVDFALKQLVAPPGLDPSHWPDPGLVDRWREQLKVLHLIRNEHLVAYRELFSGWPPHPAHTCHGDPPEGLATWYLVMDWVDGPSLHELVRKGNTTLSNRVGYLSELAEAIEVLHSGTTTGGMVLLHRDIKPSNVIIDPQRGAVLVDYGLLRVEEPILTEIPAWTGPYLAPEVHMDKTRTSRASDMWALAGTAFFALTGEHPSPGEPDRMRGQLLEHLSGRVEQPELVAEATMSALDATPGRRPTSPVAWSRRLVWALGDSATSETNAREAIVPVPSMAESESESSTHKVTTPHREPHHTVISDGALRNGNNPSARRFSPVWIAIIGALVLLGTGIGTWRVLASQSTTPPSQGSSVDGQHGGTAKNGVSTSVPSAAGSTSPDPQVPQSQTASPVTDGSQPAQLPSNQVLSGGSSNGTSTAGSCHLSFAIAGAQELTLPNAGSSNLFVAATAGGHSMQNITWAQDLSVTAAYSGNQAVSIGHSQLSTGSFESSTGNVAIAGVSLSGCVPIAVASSQTGASTTLSLTIPTSVRGQILVLVGGQGTGFLTISGPAALQSLNNATFSEAGSDVIASAAVMHMQAIGQGGTFTVSSTTFPTNSGTSLGAVAYALGS